WGKSKPSSAPHIAQTTMVRSLNRPVLLPTRYFMVKTFVPGVRLVSRYEFPLRRELFAVSPWIQMDQSSLAEIELAPVTSKEAIAAVLVVLVSSRQEIITSARVPVVIETEGPVVVRLV